MKELNEKYYETFTPAERVQLAIAALGRQDMKEVDKLYNTCPRVSYTMKDLAFMNKMQAVERITTALAALCTELLDKIKINKLILCGTHLAMNASDKGFQLGYEVGKGKKFNELEEYKPFEGVENLYGEISNDHEFLQDNIIHLKACHQAFNEVCAADDINASHLIEWFSLFETLPELRTYLDCSAVVTDEKLELYKNLFNKLLN